LTTRTLKARIAFFLDFLYPGILILMGYLLVGTWLRAAEIIDLPIVHAVGPEDLIPYVIGFGLYIILVVGFIAGRMIERRRRAVREAHSK
jgi:hypothetical protein